MAWRKYFACCLALTVRVFFDGLHVYACDARGFSWTDLGWERATEAEWKWNKAMKTYFLPGIVGQCAETRSGILMLDLNEKRGLGPSGQGENQSQCLNKPPHESGLWVAEGGVDSCLFSVVLSKYITPA